MRSSVIWILGGFLSVLSLVILKSIAPEVVVRQFWFLAFGWSVCWLLSQRSLKLLMSLAWWGYWILIGLLVAVLVVGDQTRGTVGWFELGFGLKLQPSQFAVPVVAWYVATQLTKLQTVWSWLGLRLVGVVILPLVLIAVEPDFGTAAVFLVSLVVMLLPYQVKLVHGLGLLASGMVLLIGLWFFVFKPYQKDRITSFLWQSTAYSTTESSAAYNARQAQIAVGSGGWWGQGLGQGIQSHLRFLPERQTDFVFASLAEEVGFLGSLLVVGAYAGLIWWLWRDYQPERIVQSSYILSLVVWLFVHAAINIGMNIGLVPITGITLPLLSYGGSSILANCMGLGLAMVLMRERQPQVVLKIT